LLVKIDVARALYEGGWLVAADPVLKAYQNELLALRGTITPTWRVAEGLRRFLQPRIWFWRAYAMAPRAGGRRARPCARVTLFKKLDEGVVEEEYARLEA
jgi:hypothetical protein